MSRPACTARAGGCERRRCRFVAALAVATPMAPASSSERTTASAVPKARTGVE